jgi:hypothetical protein
MKIWTYHFGRLATLHVRGGWCFSFIYLFSYLFIQRQNNALLFGNGKFMLYGVA